MHQLLGSSPAVMAVRNELSRLLARTPTAGRMPPVLIQGETGTGKGLVARLIHQMGPRASASYVDVNCAAIPDTMLEAELFGFERGAFTDAKQAKAGLLHIAHRGTIFLDEIGLMPDSLQVKLLKALEDRQVRRLGSTHAEPADAWVLAATSEDLTTAIHLRQFREDLYHRLAVMTVQLPPLRDRGDDILLLARHYLNKACTEYSISPKTLTPDAESALRAYGWPGNVRELANVMERVALMSEAAQVSASALRLSHSPRKPTAAAVAGGGVNVEITALERTRIENALRAEDWNISRAAVRLGLHRNTLRYRMERHGLTETGESPKRRRSEAAPARDADAAPAPAPSDQPAVRWEHTRLTIMQVVVHDETRSSAEHERAQLLHDLASKACGFGGRILELGPVTVRAAFGLDIVEDAARNAAHAALAMQRAATAPTSARGLQVRIALHTDEMRVGRMENRVEVDADARRGAQDVLDRLQSAAPQETILASSSTKPFIERRFTIAAIADNTEIRAWRVIGLADVEHPATPFVARARELSLLDNMLAQAEEGHGQAVLIAGDAGIGKSRLLHELRRRTRDRALWLRGSAVSFGRSLPLHPVIDLLKRALGVEASDSDIDIGRRIDEATRGLGESFQPSVRFLRSLLSVDAGDPSVAQLDPKLRRAGIFDAVRRFLLATSESRPVAVVLEDLHWMDQATIECLTLITESVSSSRILFCVTTRTGYALPFAPGVFATQLTLSNVSSADARAIGCAVLGSADLSGDLQRLVAETTDGNPFFVEEVVRSLHERGLLERHGDLVRLSHAGTATVVPDSVQDVILGRLERLDPAARTVLHVAAVIGREFPRRVLESVLLDEPDRVEALLQSLRSAELIHSVRVFPEVVYAFKHALTHDVAYRAQSDTQQQAQHARIGAAIEQIYADRLSEHLGVLAHHFTIAQEWDKALRYLLAAAGQAERTFATREALALYDEAQRAAEQLAGGAGDSRALIGIHEAKARLHFVTSDFARSAAEGERILPLARLTGNRVKEAEALATIAWASTWSRKLDEAIRFANDALAVAEPAGATGVQGRAHLTIGFVRGVTGVVDESRSAIDKAIHFSKAAGDPVHQSLSLTVAGLLRNWTGDFAEARRLQDDGLSLARESGVLVPLLFSCFMRGMTLTGKGDYDEAFDAFSEGLALTERVGDEAIYHRLLNCLGWLYSELGDLAEAEVLNTKSQQIGRRRNDPGTEPNATLNLADIYRTRGDQEAAHESYETVFRYWKDPSTSLWMRYRYSIRMFAGMGELALERGDLVSAKRHSAECLELATRGNSRKNLVKGLRLAGNIARAERDWDRAERDLRRARDIAESVGNPVQLWSSEIALGHLLNDVQKTDEARAAFGRALAHMQGVRDRLRHDRLRSAFDRAPDLAVVRNLLAGV